MSVVCMSSLVKTKVVPLCQDVLASRLLSIASFPTLYGFYSELLCFLCCRCHYCVPGLVYCVAYKSTSLPCCLSTYLSRRNVPHLCSTLHPPDSQSACSVAIHMALSSIRRTGRPHVSSTGLLFQGVSSWRSTILGMYHNCSILPLLTSVSQLRIAFYDAIDHNSATGTGGIDASILFETTSPANEGLAADPALPYFLSFYTIRTSMADLIALGVSAVVSAYGGPLIPMQGGRIDAAAAGSTIGPLASDTLSATTAAFQRAGFSGTDMIKLVACGHSKYNGKCLALLEPLTNQLYSHWRRPWC